MNNHDYAIELSKNFIYSNHFVNLSNVFLHESSTCSNKPFSHHFNQPSSSPLIVNHKIKFCNFNTNVAKRNLNFIQELIKRNDCLFLCETFLMVKAVYF